MDNYPLTRIKSPVQKFGGVVAAERGADDLQFDKFMRNGFIGHDHEIVAYPSTLKRIREGAKLPDGQRASADCWWIEFIAVNTAAAHAVIENPGKFSMRVSQTMTTSERQVHIVESVTLRALKHASAEPMADVPQDEPTTASTDTP